LGMQIAAPPPPLPEHVPAPLRAVVDALLAKTREARIPDAATASQALAHAFALAQAPGFAPPNQAPTHAGLPMATIPSMTAPVVMATVVPAKPGVPRGVWYGGAALFAVLILIAAWPSDDSDDDSSDDPSGDLDNDYSGEQVRQSEVSGSGAGSLIAAVGVVEPELYLDIDRELSAKNTAAALEQIRAARDRHPGDGGLMWREGRALALPGAQQDRLSALHRYAEALAATPALARETEFVAELGNLLRDADLRTTAIDVAVRELGATGHSFLLETINAKAGKLSYVDRHRILDALAADPAQLSRVDHDRQRILDLQQAATSPTPCTSFADALDRIDNAGAVQDLAPISAKDLAVPSVPGVGESADDCSELPAQREEVRAALAEKYPDEAAKVAKSSSGGGKKKKKGGFRFPF
jgi:hypothetical protein